MTGEETLVQQAPVYVVFSGEMLLNAPLKETWRHVINYTSWQDFSTVERISGEPGQEGELMLLKKEFEGFTFPPYCARTIKLDPDSRVIWKVYLDKGTEKSDFFGIVEYRVHEQGQQTRFWYNLIYEFIVPYRDPMELEEFKKRQYDDFEAARSTMWDRLKQLVESQPLQRCVAADSAASSAA